MMNIRNIDKIFKAYNYELYDNPYQLNLIGFRTKMRKSNSFDDILYVAYKNPFGYWIIQQYEFTTDPGKSELKRPRNAQGTAILVPNQYRNTYKLDMHRGKYLAFCQRLGKVSVYRDNNCDEWLDLDPQKIVSGYFGINIHNSDVDVDVVDGFSAGCQVTKRNTDWEGLIHLGKIHEERYGNVFSYTLLDEEQLLRQKLL